jgi:phenylpropionate dioxygenase-like ring-hydroxylating dioxygenase large terminal subunit
VSLDRSLEVTDPRKGEEMTNGRKAAVDLEYARRAAQMVDAARGLVARDIFVDDEIFKIELEHIFGRCWLFLAHESQLPNPNDYVNVKMGIESVLVCRDRQGRINAFINSCRHRGAAVCRADQGNARSFVCPYHGWTYDTTGALIHAPGENALYHGELKRAEWGLPSVAQVASYEGLIFGTFDPEAPSLEEYLGDMRWGLDLLLSQGDLVVVPGIARWVMNANWKIAADNAIGDMYHGGFTHRSAVLAGHASGTGTSRKQKLPNYENDLRPGITVVTEYGHGFNANFMNDAEIDLNSPLASWRKRPEVKQRLGEVGAKINRANMNVFPNLFVNSGSRELMLRNPLSPTELEIWKFVLVDKNASPEVQRDQVRASNRHFGPAGMFEQDDGENWDQSTLGAIAPVTRRSPLNYSMGVGKGEVHLHEAGLPPHVNTLVNEHAQLWLPELKRNHIRPEGIL